MNLFQRYLAEEFVEDFAEGRLSRRQALKLIASVTGSVVMADSLLAACAPSSVLTAEPPTFSAQVPQASVTPPAPPGAEPSRGSAIEAGAVSVPGEGTELKGYLARPEGAGAAPVVLVCHENRGLTPHIEDVTRRLAAAGYVGLAIDLLTRQGGTPSLDPADVPGLLGNTSPDQFVQDFLSGWRYLQGQSYAQAERVGMVGFCFGGGVTWLMATHMPELKAAVPFYGPHPPVGDVPKIRAAVLAIYAGRDERINQGIPAIEAAMQEHGKVYEKVIYPETDHAFHNDTGSRYNADAAQDAWSRTLAWFGRYVKSS